MMQVGGGCVTLIFEKGLDETEERVRGRLVLIILSHCVLDSPSAE
jgi:hypothetical protein